MLESDLIQQKGTSRDVDSYSAFADNYQGSETALRARLQAEGVTTVFCAGVAYDYCVGSTALDAAGCGFKSYLVQDCAAVVGPERESKSKRAMDAALEEAGVVRIAAADVPAAAVATSGRLRLAERGRSGWVDGGDGFIRWADEATPEKAPTADAVAPSPVPPGRHPSAPVATPAAAECAGGTARGGAGGVRSPVFDSPCSPGAEHEGADEFRPLGAPAKPATLAALLPRDQHLRIPAAETGA